MPMFMIGLSLLLLSSINGQVFRFIYDPEPPVTVTQLVEGRMTKIQQGYSLIGSVSLVQDSGYNILVDSPSSTDVASKDKMLEGLSQRSLLPSQIQLVIQTHGHPDHFGQGNFFPNARHFFGSYEYIGDTFIRTELYQNNSMPLTPNTELWSTPGHTSQDLSLIIRQVPNLGTVAVVGDLFYSEADAFNSTTWETDAWSSEIGGVNRKRIVCMVDAIIPGHDRQFRVSQALRQKYGCPPPRSSTPADTIYHPTTPSSHHNQNTEMSSNRVVEKDEQEQEPQSFSTSEQTPTQSLVGAVVFPGDAQSGDAQRALVQPRMLQIRTQDGNSASYLSNYAVPLVPVISNHHEPQSAMLMPMLESAANRLMNSLFGPPPPSSPSPPLPSSPSSSSSSSSNSRTHRASSKPVLENPPKTTSTYTDMLRNTFHRLAVSFQTNGNRNKNIEGMKKLRRQNSRPPPPSSS